MSNPAGEPSDGLHFQRLAELPIFAAQGRVCSSAFRDIHATHDNTFEPVLPSVLMSGANLQKNGCAVFCPELYLVIGDLA
ncbi:MAG: hypothetical protein EWM73_02837 [Nitrospira sp.]|nr:MAG: hypothetical protein EWM73_02837 [Nitrospira sp.]